LCEPAFGLPFTLDHVYLFVRDATERSGLQDVPKQSIIDRAAPH
jgi:hypothetical protein